MRILDHIKFAWAADERSALDGAPAWSPTARLAAATSMIVAYPVAVAAATIAATDAKDDGRLVVVEVLSVGAMAAARYVMRSDRRTRLIDADEEVLDERERWVRATALAAAYRVSQLMTLVIAGLGYLSLRTGLALHALSIYALLGASLFVIPSLPAICHIARNRHEPSEP